jgi:cell division septal protein FtsQ
MAKTRKNNSGAPAFFLVVVLPLAAMVFSTFAISQGIRHYLVTSDYFRVRELKIDGLADTRYLGYLRDELMGVNIFHVKTRDIADRIMKRYPTFYSVTVQRVLPSRLVIEAKERQPVAVLRRDKHYVFDVEGVAVASYPLEMDVRLPLIIGCEDHLTKIKLGVAYPDRVLRDALRLAQSLRSRVRLIASSVPPGGLWRVTRIDVSDPGKPVFYIGAQVQVRVSYKDAQTQIDLLPSILKTVSPELNNVKYIDLRPREPVIAMKDQDKTKT